MGMVVSAEDHIPYRKERREVSVKVLLQPAVMDTMQLRSTHQPAEFTETEFEVGMNEE